jgi:hypothetical protein
VLVIRQRHSAGALFENKRLWARENFEAFIALGSSQPGFGAEELYPKTIKFCGLRSPAAND